MSEFERITINPDQMNGRPCIRNQRITVERVLKLLAVYPDRQELFLDYPTLDNEDIRQVLLYTAARFAER